MCRAFRERRKLIGSPLRLWPILTRLLGKRGHVGTFRFFLLCRVSTVRLYWHRAREWARLLGEKSDWEPIQQAIADRCASLMAIPDVDAACAAALNCGRMPRLLHVLAFGASDPDQFSDAGMDSTIVSLATALGSNPGWTVLFHACRGEPAGESWEAIKHSVVVVDWSTEVAAMEHGGDTGRFSYLLTLHLLDKLGGVCTTTDAFWLGLPLDRALGTGRIEVVAMLRPADGMRPAGICPSLIAAAPSGLIVSRWLESARRLPVCLDGLDQDSRYFPFRSLGTDLLARITFLPQRHTLWLTSQDARHVLLSPGGLRFLPYMDKTLIVHVERETSRHSIEPLVASSGTIYGRLIAQLMPISQDRA